MSHGETYGGVVTAVNGGSRFVLDGGEWLHISKWAEAGTTAPLLGDVVEVRVDSKGFVRAIREVDVSKPTAATAPTSAAPTPWEDKDRRITRLAVLNTATAILSSGNRPTTAADVAALAAKLETWVFRPVTAGKAEANNG